MNIFYLDNNPTKCAEYHCNKHVVKMIIEYAQLLCNAHDQELVPYKRTHYNHPSAKWVRESNGNYAWLYSLFLELSNEYTKRYGKIHKTTEKVLDCIELFPKTVNLDHTEPPQCMPNEYKNKNCIQAYREYYRKDKKHFAKWFGEEPKFMKGNLNDTTW